MGQDCTASASTANACTSWNCEALLEHVYNNVKLLTDDDWSRLCKSFPPWWMSLWCGPWTLPWPWRRTLINCQCHWLAKDLSCETWSQILTFSWSCLVVRHVHIQKLIHVPTMWTFVHTYFWTSLCGGWNKMNILQKTFSQKLNCAVSYRFWIGTYLQIGWKPESLMEHTIQMHAV